MSAVSKRLKWLREVELQLTTRELVDAMAKVGVKTSNASVTRYEKGRDPAVSYVVAMAALLESTVDFVLYAKAPRERTATMKEMRADYIAKVVTGDLDKAVVAEIGPGGRVQRAGKSKARPGKRKTKVGKGSKGD